MQPDGIYLQLSNLLLQNNNKNMGNFKLVDITYFRNKIRKVFECDGDGVDGDYVIENYINHKQVYVKKDDSYMKLGVEFNFHNLNGLEIIIQTDNDLKYICKCCSNDEDNRISISYSKYLLISIKYVELSTAI